MHSRHLRHLPVVLLALAACGTSPDAQRSEMERALNDASNLATEITAWRIGVPNGDVSSKSTDTIASFRERAENLLDRIQDLSADAKRGYDLGGVELALKEISTFETDGFVEASTSGRAAMLDQFATQAASLRRAVIQTRSGR